MLFVSHDRTFLRGLAKRVLECGGEDAPASPSPTALLAPLRLLRPQLRDRSRPRRPRRRDARDLRRPRLRRPTPRARSRSEKAPRPLLRRLLQRRPRRAEGPQPGPASRAARLRPGLPARSVSGEPPRPHGRASSPPPSRRLRRPSPSSQTGPGSPSALPERSRPGAAPPRCRPWSPFEPASTLCLAVAENQTSYPQAAITLVHGHERKPSFDEKRRARAATYGIAFGASSLPIRNHKPISARGHPQRAARFLFPHRRPCCSEHSRHQGEAAKRVSGLRSNDDTRWLGVLLKPLDALYSHTPACLRVHQRDLATRYPSKGDSRIINAHWVPIGNGDREMTCLSIRRRGRRAPRQKRKEQPKARPAHGATRNVAPPPKPSHYLVFSSTTLAYIFSALSRYSR